jgi:uncharacterized protein YbaR (Trm112 family)
MEQELLEKLCCPETHQLLRLAEPALLEKLNQRAAAGQLRNRAGRSLEAPVEGGLVRQDGRWMYPVRQNIPIMLIDEAIEVG